jgi:hypothetical protein
MPPVGGRPRPAPKPIARRRTYVAPKKSFTPPPPEVAKSAPRSKANVEHAKREIMRQAAPPAPHHLTHPERAPQRFKERPPFRLVDPVTPAAKKQFAGGPRAIKDTKTGAVYFQHKTPTDRQVSHALKRLFHGETHDEQAKGLVQLEKYGLVGNKAASSYAFKAQPILHPRRVRLGYAPGGKPILDMAHFEQDAKGRKVFDVNLGGRKFQAVHGDLGQLIPITNLNKLPGAAQRVVKGGAFAGEKTLGALGTVFHYTGTPGRKAADALGLKGGGLKGVGRTALEILGDPTTYISAGAGAGLKGGTRAAVTAARLERAGVNLQRVKGLNALVHEAAHTGDARRLADALQGVERTMQRRGVQRSATTTQRIAKRAIERGHAGSTYLPGAEATDAVTARVAPKIRDLRRSGAHIGVLTPAGSKISRGRVLPEVSAALPKALTRAVKVPVGTKVNQAALRSLREERARVGAVAKHAGSLRAAHADLKSLEDLGPAAGHEELTAARQRIQDIHDTVARDVNTALDHISKETPRLGSLEEKRAIKTGRSLAHDAIISSAESGRVTRASIGKSIDDAIKPLRKELGTGKKLDDSLARVQFHLWAREAGGGAAREALPKLTAKEQEVFDGLDGVYRAMRDAGRGSGLPRAMPSRTTQARASSRAAPRSRRSMR